MLIHPLKTFHEKKKSTLALRIAFEVMVKKQNLILLRGKEISFVNLNVWTTSVNGGVVALHWKLPQAPCSLLSTLAAMTQSYQIVQHVPGPSSLHPGRGLGSQKHNGFSRGTVTFTVSLADPSRSWGWSVHLGPKMWESLGSRGSLGTMVASPVVLSGMCGVQRIETILLYSIFPGWHSLIDPIQTLCLFKTADSMWWRESSYCLTKCKFDKSVIEKHFWDFKNIINDF